VPSAFSVDRLVELLGQQFGIDSNDRLALAFSGGGDSTALLHALLQARPRVGFGLRVLHVDHGLNLDSPKWAERCEEVCRRLDVRYQSGRVQVVRHQAGGIEAAAREARYDWLCRQLATDETLVLAHHADDQLETVLFRLLRGAGARGLRAIHSDSIFYERRLIRPLLGFSREQLQAWGQTQSLEWLEDPANSDEDFDRVYLRRQVIPSLKQRWPVAAQQAAQSCQYLAETVAVADELAFSDLQAGRISGPWSTDAPTFSCAHLAGLPTYRLSNAIHYWCGQFASAPRGRLQSLLELVQSTTERGEVRYQDLVFRRYRDGLFTFREGVSGDPDGGDSNNEFNWQDSSSSVDAGSFQIDWWPSAGRGVSLQRLESVSTTLGAGRAGDSVRLLWQGHHRNLKQLCQILAVPPWDRSALPRLLTKDGEIIAFPGLCVSDDWLAAAGETGICFSLIRRHGLDLGETWTKSL